MVKEELVSFIKSARERGYEDSVIQSVLVKKGWDEGEVRAALSAGPVVSRSSAVVSKSSWKLYLGIGLGLLGLVLLSGVLFWSFSGEEEFVCEQDSDCSSGYECSSGDCVASVECRRNSDCSSGYECSSGDCVRVQEQIEFGFEEEEEELEEGCQSDADCGEGFFCEERVCYIEVVQEQEDVALSNFVTSSLSVDSLSDEEANVSFSYELDAAVEGSVSVVLACVLYDEEGVELSAVNVSVSQELVTGSYTQSCLLSVDAIYGSLAAGENVSVIVLGFVDAENAVQESDDEDNVYYETLTWLYEDFVVSEDSACGADSECSPYACDDSSLTCFSSCSSDSDCYGDGGYSCVEGLCAEETGAVSCVSDEDCSSGELCSEGFCAVSGDESVSDEASCVDADCSPYLCDEGSDACFGSCSSDAACDTDAGYRCIGASCVITECNDVDGGKNYYESGSIYGYGEEGNFVESEDRCDSAGTDTVREWYCDGSVVRREEVSCPALGDYVCSSGACVSAEEDVPRCADGVDNEGDGAIDLGGCDCDEDGVIDTGFGSESALTSDLCGAEPGKVFETGSGNYYTAWCSSGDGGVWYDGDTECDNSEDDSEGPEDETRAARKGAAGVEENVLVRVWGIVTRFLFFWP